MIYGKMWTIVRPQVGIPLFLSGVAIGSFAVHLALLTNTPWLQNYYKGPAARAAAAATTQVTQPVAMAAQAAPADTVK